MVACANAGEKLGCCVVWFVDQALCMVSSGERWVWQVKQRLNGCRWPASEWVCCLLEVAGEHLTTAVQLLPGSAGVGHAGTQLLRCMPGLRSCLQVGS